MIEGRVFDHQPIGNLMAIVKNDFKKFDDQGLIDDGVLVKSIMWCNEKLGIPIREVREAAIQINEFKAELPLDFEKLYYTAALKCSNTSVVTGRNPFDNHFDSDVIYEACLNRERLGCVDDYQVVINRKTHQTIYQHGEWTELGITSDSANFCHIDCPNKRRVGKYQIRITDEGIETPFRSGLIYIMYLGMMKDDEGNITFPFHPMITPFYEWAVKERVLLNAAFNSDGNVGDLLKLAKEERKLAWIDAFNFTTEKAFGTYVDAQRKRELGFYNQYFKYLQ